MAPKMEGKEMNIASSNEESKHTKKRRKNSTLDGNYIENNIRMTNSFIPTLRVFSFPSIYVQYALLLLKTADNWSPKVIISRFRSLLRVECAWAFSRNHFRTVKKKVRRTKYLNGNSLEKEEKNKNPREKVWPRVRLTRQQPLQMNCRNPGERKFLLKRQLSLMQMTMTVATVIPLARPFILG